MESESYRPGWALSVRPAGASSATRLAGGHALIEHEISFNATTVINVGSIAKQFVARLISMLCQDEAMRPQQPLSDWFPGLAGASDISVADLVAHRSGIRDYGALLAFSGKREFDYISRFDILELLHRQKSLAFSPRTELHYSNSNYVLLAFIAELVSGQSLQGFAKKAIFDPLGMSLTTFIRRPDDVIAHRAESYETSSPELRRADRAPGIPGPSGLYSAVRDLEIWLAEAPRSEKRWEHTGGEHAGGGIDYQDGLFIERAGHDRWLAYHGGDDQGFSSFIGWSSDGAAICALSNAASVDADAAGLTCLKHLGDPELSSAAVGRLATALGGGRSPGEPAASASGPGASASGPGAASDPGAESAPSDEDVRRAPFRTFSSQEISGSIDVAKFSERILLVRRGTAIDECRWQEERSVFAGPGYDCAFANDDFLISTTRIGVIRLEAVSD